MIFCFKAKDYLCSYLNFALKLLNVKIKMNIKPHYLLLDGLRGAAALMVLWYHVFEGFAFAGGSVIETFNHGHLGVDFFFMLSGFVISYAYDDRWKKCRDVTPVASQNVTPPCGVSVSECHPCGVSSVFLNLTDFWIHIRDIFSNS